MTKTTRISVGTAILLASVALAWGTGPRIAKQAQSTAFRPLELNVDTKSLPEHNFIDRSFIFPVEE